MGGTLSEGRGCSAVVRSENRENCLMEALKLLIMPNAKLSYPEQAHKLWCDVNGEENRSYETDAPRLGVSCSALFGGI